MSRPYDELTLPDNFNGMVRLFPISKMVLYPGVGQMLHIFEPRYCTMMEDALDSDRLITMANLYSDQLDGFGNPKINQTVCIAQIVEEVRQEDGRYNLFVLGVQRARILREIDSEKPYRLARVEVLPAPNDGDDEFPGAREELLKDFVELAKTQDHWDADVLAKFVDPELPLSRMVDMIAYTAGVESEFRQRVLATDELGPRIILVSKLLQDLLKYVRRPEPAKRDFPPKFSAN
ncbi:MAG: LON peptidase substrate-binding domain-containing protein [Planctomycetota bacterium]